MIRVQSEKILDGETASGAVGEIRMPTFNRMTFQAVEDVASGTGVSSITIEGSNMEVEDPGDRLWVELGVIGLTSAEPSDGFAINAPWRWVRARATTITPGSTVDVWMGAGGD